MLKLIKTEQAQAAVDFEDTQQTVRHFKVIHYSARSWHQKRPVIAKIEHLAKGHNPRFILTNLEGDAKALYDDIYCARGDMENRIKEQQMGLFADRTSCHDW